MFTHVAVNRVHNIVRNTLAMSCHSTKKCDSVKQMKTVSSQKVKNFLSQRGPKKKFARPWRFFFFGRTSDTVFLCFTESNIVCGEGKGQF